MWIETLPMFLLGGAGYVAIELLYRGRSHISMFFAGGVCFLLLGKLEKVKPRLPGLLRPVAGAGIITTVELAAGMLFNRNYAVWDYRGLPGNYLMENDRTSQLTSDQNRHNQKNRTQNNKRCQ